MSTKIFIPTPLRQYAGKRDAVEVHASTVSDALSKLTVTHPDLKRHLYTDDGKLRAFVNVYLNDEDVRYLSEKENTRVKDGDHLSIIPSIAGGCHCERSEESLSTPLRVGDSLVRFSCGAADSTRSPNAHEQR